MSSPGVAAPMPPDHTSVRNMTNRILTVVLFIYNIIVFADFLSIISSYAWVIICCVLFKILQRVVQYYFITGALDGQSFCRHVFDFNKLTGIIIVMAIIIIALFSSNIKSYNLLPLPVFFGVLYLLEFAKYFHSVRPGGISSSLLRERQISSSLSVHLPDTMSRGTLTGCQSCSVLDDCKFLTSCWIECPTGINYATGMAYSFFFGYLNITLPDHGDDNVGFKEMMERYESVQHVKFPVKKIFILVPTQLHCPPNLADACQGSDDVHLEACENLGVVVRSVAGVVNRQYKHSVYKIHSNDGSLPIYVVAECATPLHTYYKVIERAGPHQEHYERHQGDVVLQFYKSLKEIIENSIECKNLCEVVYFDNLNPKINAARVLLDKIYEVRGDKKN